MTNVEMQLCEGSYGFDARISKTSGAITKIGNPALTLIIFPSVIANHSYDKYSKT
jgi:hypothetical protein